MQKHKKCGSYGGGAESAPPPPPPGSEEPQKRPLLIGLTPSNSHNNLGMTLDSKLNLNNHLSEKISKANKGIGIIRRLYKFLPRTSLINSQHVSY